MPDGDRIMAKLTGKLGAWELPHVHMWKDRTRAIGSDRRPLIQPKSRIATIGSCFAAELADAMSRLGLDGAMHPAGLFYTSRSIRQEMERIFGEGAPPDLEMWRTTKGFVHPLRDYHRSFLTADEARAWNAGIERDARALFSGCDILVVTLGLIEAWHDPKTRLHYPQIPHPELFPSLGAEFHRLTVQEILEDLEAIRRLLRANTHAEIIVTVSPVPLHSTMTALDVRVANTESKSRIRAAVSEFVERNPDIHYFHSYEIVTTAERQSDFMMEDGRHVERRGVEYILADFMRMFAADGVRVPEVDASWLLGPTQTAERVPPRTRSFAERVVGRIQRLTMGR
jgi:hypothetical protein